MFYEVLGALVQAAAEPVAAAGAGDEVDQFHARRAAQALERIGGAWPHLFAALQQENRLLAEALGESPGGAETGAGDAPDSAETGAGDAPDSDPLAENRRLLLAVDEALASTGDPAVRRRLRSALADAADLQRAALKGSLVASQR